MQNYSHAWLLPSSHGATVVVGRGVSTAATGVDDCVGGDDFGRSQDSALAASL